MKTIFQVLCTVAVISLMSSCGDKNHYVINGTVDTEMNGKTIYMFNIYGESADPVDSTVVADGGFTFQGTVEEP